MATSHTFRSPVTACLTWAILFLARRQFNEGTITPPTGRHSLNELTCTPCGDSADILVGILQRAEENLLPQLDGMPDPPKIGDDVICSEWKRVTSPDLDLLYAIAAICHLLVGGLPIDLEQIPEGWALHVCLPTLRDTSPLGSALAVVEQELFDHKRAIGVMGMLSSAMRQGPGLT